MGKMKLTEVQGELLTQAALELERVQQQNTIILTAILAGDNVKKASNVNHENGYLVWDDPPDQADPSADVDKVVAQMTSEARKADASEPTGPELLEEVGDSDGPEVSVPEERESEPVVEAPLG